MNLINEIFGKLIVIAEADPINYSKRWVCRCECGKEKIVYQNALRSGATKSCGCWSAESAKKRMSKGFAEIFTKEYLIEHYVNFQLSLREIARQNKTTVHCVQKYIRKHNIDIATHVYDIVGKKFNQLTVIKRAPNRNTRQSWWLCKCDCGAEKEIRGLSLVNNKTKSCGCAPRVAHNFTGCGQISGSYWAQIKRGAKARNILFELDIQDAWTKFEKQNGKCSLSGLTIVLKKNLQDRGQTASLDRIDSTKHYFKENIQWVHVDVNKMKNNLSEDRLFELCSLISKNISL